MIEDYEYLGVEYDIPTQIDTVCDLQPLMNTGTTVVTAEAIEAASYYHYQNGSYSNAPWLSEESGQSVPVFIFQYWQGNTTDYTLSAETCQLPDVLYGTGTTENTKRGTVFSVDLTDESSYCIHLYRMLIRHNLSTLII